MKVVQINHFSYKAAGSIMMNLHNEMLKRGIDSYVVWGRGREAQNEHEYYMDDKLGVNLHALYTRLTDRTGFASIKSTEKLINKLEEIQPDIIHLHCVHGYYINLKLLFNYIRKNKIKVVWTQHDCWSFTGHCAYFDAIGCEKWKTGCHSCKQLRTYPAAYIDASKKNWIDKKKLFSGLDIQIVTPCKWLSGLVKESFLGEYPVEVIYNGIDDTVFNRTSRKFRIINGIENKFMILGVASEWTERKGLKDIISLYEKLNPDDYQIVVVGLTEDQLKQVPEGIIALQRTSNVQELVDIYSSADLFFNPTYEDNFPTTNIESIACGTPVLTYRTGGSPEAVGDSNGAVVSPGDLESVINIIDAVKSGKKEFTVKLNEEFKKSAMIDHYLQLYSTMER